MTRTISSRRAGTVALLAVLLVALMAATLSLGAAPARAEEGDEARIQDLTSADGTITFALSAIGLGAEEELRPESVRVSIAGTEVPATARFIETEAAPVARTAMLVLDTSGSMADEGRLDIAKQSALAYLDGMPAEVAVGLITFADTAQMLVAPTTDRARIREVVSGLGATGSTALYDATLLALQQLGTEGSRNTLLLSDGEDQGSANSRDAVLAALAESGAPLDAVSLQPGLGEEQLAELAGAGGGVVVASSDAGTVTEAFASAARAASNQLLVTVDVPDEIEAGTATISASVDTGSRTISDDAVIVVDAQTQVAEAPNYGPQPVAIQEVGVFQQDWFLPALIAVIFLALLTILWLALRSAVPDGRTASGLGRELSSYGPSAMARSVKQAAQGADPNVIASRAVAMAESVVHHRDPDRKLERKLDTAGVPLRPAEWAVLHASIALTATFLSAALTGFNWLWVLVGLAAGIFLPYAFLDIKATRRRDQFAAALPDVLQLMAGSLASGYSFPQAVDTVARESSGPMSQELSRALTESRLGVPIEDALEEVAVRMDSKDFAWVVMAVRINRQVGGNLSDVLRTVAHTLRERERVRRQVQTLSAEGRVSAWILGILPFAIAGYMFLVRPEYIGLLFTNPLGWLMVIAAIFLLAVGIVWMRKIIQVEV